MIGDDEIKIIHQTGYPAIDDDNSMPFLVHVNLRPPEFMQVTFVMMYGGSEEVIARCATRDAVDRFLVATDARKHPRLRWIRIRGPSGEAEEILPHRTSSTEPQRYTA